MYNYLFGEITDIIGGAVVVDVNGVGYEVNVSAYTMSDCKLGEKRKLYCYLQVKEDGMALFGFSTIEEKNMFINLISVSGIGCKVALSVLSGLDCNSLAMAIYNQDTSLLTKIKGLGKKTAERIVLELKEKVVVDASNVDLPVLNVGDSALTKEMQNAIAVLCSLGKSQADAQKLVEASSKLGATTAEELINMSFRID